MSDKQDELSVLYATPLSDVVGRLRAIADEIESDPTGVRSCVILIDWMGAHNDYAVDLRSLGITDPVRTLGTLQIAAHELCSQINDGPVYRAVSRT